MKIIHSKNINNCKYIIGLCFTWLFYFKISRLSQCVTCVFNFLQNLLAISGLHYISIVQFRHSSNILLSNFATTCQQTLLNKYNSVCKMLRKYVFKSLWFAGQGHISQETIPKRDRNENVASKIQTQITHLITTAQ